MNIQKTFCKIVKIYILQRFFAFDIYFRDMSAYNTKKHIYYIFCISSIGTIDWTVAAMLLGK